MEMLAEYRLVMRSRIREARFEGRRDQPSRRTHSGLVTNVEVVRIGQDPMMVEFLAQRRIHKGGLLSAAPVLSSQWPKTQRASTIIYADGRTARRPQMFRDELG